MESHHDLIPLFEHDLFGKPVSTFPDHALGRVLINQSVVSASDAARSALRSEADMRGVLGHVRLVPKRDIAIPLAEPAEAFHDPFSTAGF